jgi:hypothetical protein
MSDIGHYSTTSVNTRKSPSNKVDMFDVVSKFNEEVMKNKPSVDTMKIEIRMNALKIRPYAGDVFHLNMSNTQFIDALWSILKLEEYVLKTEKKLPRKEVMTFYQLMGQYREKLQEQINRVDMRLPHIKKQGIENPVTIEIFRDARGSRKT